MNVLGLPSAWWIQFAVFLTVLGLLARPFGFYMARVYMGERTFMTPFLQPLEQGIYKLCGINPADEMDWKTYAKTLLIFSFLCALSLFLIALFQPYPSISWDTAFNICISFATGANWQNFVSETTVSMVTQMAGIAVQGFFSAATAMAAFLALTRALTRDRARTLGNYWVDVVRSILYIFLPLCLILSLFLLSQGVPQTFAEFQNIPTLETGSAQTLMTGPLASQVAIKQIGTNGGGYFTANAAHPFENPTPLSNFVQIFAMILCAAASTFAFGKMTGRVGHGTALLAAMLIIFIPLTVFLSAAEQAGHPLFSALGIDQSLGNLEGKEVRHGTTGSTLWSAVTTATANGATNASLDSFAPLASATTLFFIHLGEVVFGGVGSGLYSLLIFVFFTVFLASLLTGRTPEYLGKKIGIFDMQMMSLVILTPVLFSLGGTMLALLTDVGREGATNPQAQGYNQILYAYSSAANTNGSALAGIRASSPFYNLTLGLCMLFGRYGVIAAVLALAGSLVEKRITPPARRSLDATSFLFIFMVVCGLLMAAMTYIPAIALGFAQEHFLLVAEGR